MELTESAIYRTGSVPRFSQSLLHSCIRQDRLQEAGKTAAERCAYFKYSTRPRDKVQRLSVTEYGKGKKHG